jgi:2-oxoglutarate ferredoxin oxidoreductase subunit alpha
MTTETHAPEKKPHQVQEVDNVVIRFAGDSGDGMQLTGTMFTHSSALVGNDISTLPDFPAEIRAPAGTLPGVSGFQLNFSSLEILTPGDEPVVLIAMNPAALRTNLRDLAPGGLVILNEDMFRKNNLIKAKYDVDPREDGTLNGYRVVSIPISRLTDDAVKESGIGHKLAGRCKNMFALGVVFWLYDRPLDHAEKAIQQKFGKTPEVAEGNRRALLAGYHYAETAELLPAQYHVARARLVPGKYRMVMGNEATALGFVVAANLAGKDLFYGSYPITPASDILHELSRFKSYGVRTFQAEDEIAAVGSTIGAAFGGAIAVTGTSGPGLALKSEAIGLGVMTELPFVIIDVQRGGPSTGLPTKTEQADLLQAMFGRNGECPVCIIAPATPVECFYLAIEAVRLATKFMIPVIFLTDGYLANGAEPWLLPKTSDLKPIEIHHRTDPEGFLPYERQSDTLARPWVVPGTPGLEHRIGGLEKEDLTGGVSYDPANHQRMVDLRAEKIERIANFIPDAEIEGEDSGDVLVIGWGSTYGATRTAVQRAQRSGKKVSLVHLRNLNPFPRNLGDVLRRFRKVLVPEMNKGQLLLLLRARYMVDAIGLNKVEGLPFKIGEIERKIDELI